MAQYTHTIKLRRITVERWTSDCIYGDGVVVCNPDLIPTTYLKVGIQLNLLLSERQPNGSLLPQHIVLDPDFLVDVTSICRCFTHHGDAPAMHIMQKFMPSTTTAPILLGNAANQFLDDCVNAPEGLDSESLYRMSLRKTFSSDPLRFATTQGIDQDFSHKCREMYGNIHTTVSQHLPGKATLESAFLCEALGIQGRMDMMTTDHRTIVELKSGKADEWGGHTNYRYEHALQMALYKESLYYNEGLPYAQVSTLLFYARYPELMDIHLGRKDIHRAIHVRNGIVHLEHLMRENPEGLLSSLAEQHFNVLGCNDNFYKRYLQPPIIKFLHGLHGGSQLAQKYFHTMVAFIEREQFLAKTGREGVNLPAGYYGFADTWRADTKTKLSSGRIIPDLQLKPIIEDSKVVALDARTTRIDESSNFRVGDMVMLYPQSDVHQAAAFYISCIIETLSANSIRLHLRYPQHDTSLFSDDETLFAIEPAHADSGYTVLYRGLYAFLSLNSFRQQLILAQRSAKFDSFVTLNTNITDDSLRDIILRAKQARDYFLLVGPPGTGKTSIALRQMVLEFLSSVGIKDADVTIHNESKTMVKGSLLLLAFTNRAVDEICTMLQDISAPYLRLGPELSCAQEHRSHLLSVCVADYPTRTDIRNLLITTPIIVGTIASISSLPELFRLKHFHAAIIDEASQALEPHLLPLFCATDEQDNVAIDKFILIGDHKQLPAVVVQSPSESRVQDTSLHAIGLTDCRRSFFERLHEMAIKHGTPEVIGVLNRQGRMHEDIGDYVNRHYYQGQLQVVPLPHQTGPLALSVLSQHRMIGIHVPADPKMCTPKSNPAEAREVALLISKIAQELKIKGEILDWKHRLGVIVPFRGQITWVRRALAEVEVPDYDDITIDTVERYQGSQRDIIIFSTTVSTTSQLSILSQPIVMDGELLDRKLNVAVTRARQQFILVGNFELLRTCVPYRQLADELIILHP